MQTGWFGFGTFSTSKLYYTIGVGNILRRASGQHRHIIKQ